jgi:hypothetical protein
METTQEINNGSIQASTSSSKYLADGVSRRHRLFRLIRHPQERSYTRNKYGMGECFGDAITVPNVRTVTAGCMLNVVTVLAGSTLSVVVVTVLAG